MSVPEEQIRDLGITHIKLIDESEYKLPTREWEIPTDIPVQEKVIGESHSEGQEEEK